MTKSTHRHYKSYSKCHGNERLKRKAFRRLRKTDIEGADCGRDVLGQTVPGMSSSNRKGPITIVGRLFTPWCGASVTKQYKLVPVKAGK